MYVCMQWHIHGIRIGIEFACNSNSNIIECISDGCRTSTKYPEAKPRDIWPQINAPRLCRGAFILHLCALVPASPGSQHDATHSFFSLVEAKHGSGCGGTVPEEEAEHEWMRRSSSSPQICALSVCLPVCH